MTTSSRGFSTAEYRARVARAQAAMAPASLGALLMTTEPEVRYFSGFLTRFWESPTRPWFLVVPASGDPIAVIPSIGAALMGRTWIDDVRTWRSPDLEDDGISLLIDVLRETVGASGTIGLPMGHESHLRMPLADYERLSERLSPLRIADDGGIIRDLRMVKSEAEIEKIGIACEIAGRAFGRLPEVAAAGRPLAEVFRRFQMLCLEGGADWVPYLAGGAGPGGYDDVISPATDRPLADGDVLMLDTGLVWDGYFCDFDRNFAIGEPSSDVESGYARLIEAVDAAMDVAQPGATAAQLFHAMDRIVSGDGGGSDAGRLGHGLGMQLTEWPSLIPDDHSVLTEGMVLTLEPVTAIDAGRMLVHEENIVIGKRGAELLSPPAARRLPVLGTAR